jgi:RNA polymerase-binding transcription factor DksA
VYLVRPTNPAPDDKDPVIMRRRELIAVALGLTTAAALPGWAASAAETPDADHTLRNGSWEESYSKARNELDHLARHYVTEPGMSSHSDVRDSGLWLYAQANTLRGGAPARRANDARRLAAEAAMFAAGCYVDFGHMQAATELYSRAHYEAGPDNPDLRAFISAQANWVPMYSGQWHTVLRRCHSMIPLAERHGGPALLMAYTHRAKAHAVLGNREAARQDLATAQANIARVSGATGPHHALHYNATKVWFSSAGAYAAMGERHQHADARAHAQADPTLGWMDRQLMQIGEATLDHDPEMAAHRIRFQLLGIAEGGFAHCVKADAQAALARLKARELTRYHQTGPEVTALGQYLATVKVAA